MTFEILLDVAIGLVLVFVLTSILASALNEIVSASMNRRGRLLEQALYQLLDGEKPKRGRVSHALSRAPAIRRLKHGDTTTNGDDFFNHPAIKLMRTEGGLPSFIEPRLAGEVMAALAEKKSYTGTEADGEKSAFLDVITSPTIMGATSQEQRAEYLYKYQMDRISGWYKRRTQFSLFFIGLFLAFLLNIDTLRVASALAENANLREQTFAAAQVYEAARQDETGLTSSQAYNQFQKAYTDLSTLCLPIGWNQQACNRTPATDTQNVPDVETVKVECERPKMSDSMSEIMAGTFSPSQECTNETATTVVQSAAEDVEADQSPQSNGQIDLSSIGLWQVLGWILTALAAALGAPFWFDLLGRLVNVRNTGVKPATVTSTNDAQRTGDETPLLEPEVPPPPPHETGRSATLNAYEAGLSDADCVDVALVLGFPDAEDKRILFDPAFIRAIREQQASRGMRETGELSEGLVTELFAA